MGIARVACLAAWLAGVPDVTRTSTLSPTSSAAKRWIWSGFPSPNRGEEAHSEDSEECDTSEHHAATAVC